MTKHDDSTKEIKSLSEIIAPTKEETRNRPGDGLSLEALISEATKARDEAYNKLTLWEAAWHHGGWDTDNLEFDELNKQLKLLIDQREQIKKIGIEKKEESVGVLTPWDKYVPEVLDTIGGVSKSGYYFYQYQALQNQLADANLSPEKKKALEEAVTTNLLNLIKNAGVMQHFRSIGIVRDFVTNFVVPKITNCPNIFSGVEKNFVRQLIATSLELLSTTLKEPELNEKVRDIVAKYSTPIDNSILQIIANSAEILVDSTVNKIIANDLIKLLENPTNQKELTKIAANYLGEHSSIPIKLLENTISLIINNSSSFLSTFPGFLNIYQEYLKYQKATANLLADPGNPDSVKQEVVKLQQDLISSILEQSKEVVNPLAPILKAELPNYIVVNQANILDLLKTSAVQKNLLSPTAANFIIDVAPNAIPFVNDFLPLIIELAEEGVKKQEDLKDLKELAKYIPIIMNSDGAERVENIAILLKLLGQFKDKNPHIQAIVEQKIPQLLRKHVENLGDIIERLLSDNEWGKILRPKGENIIKFLSDIFSDYSKEIVKISALYNQEKYKEMVLFLIPWSLDLLQRNKHFRTLIREVIANYCGYLIEKYIISNSRSEKVNKIIEDTTKEPLKEGEKYDLAKAFKEKGIKADEGSTINLEKVFISNKLEYCDIPNFIFDKSVFLNASFNNSVLQNCSFKGAHLTGASFVGAVLQDCSFKDVKFTGGLKVEGMSMDQKTAATFWPAIWEYTQNPLHQKLIDTIKITGEQKKQPTTPDMGGKIGAKFTNLNKPSRNPSHSRQ